MHEIIENQKTRPLADGVRVKSKSAVAKTKAAIDKGDLAFAQQPPSQCDIDMGKVYDSMQVNYLLKSFLLF